ncbi:hypothetical protein [Blastococcus tunisiensis]|uniref:Uncharacterized protein n=1 Tax=Blastococcus tunisiensis TaxID=1798228 RepID=A0A1I2I147_9ACTN|nr:hypothetical protein [Blastococcus sp. DSM 46838]SFF34807.1 hypothetical protein SAMN05216574_1124 [Blastococcus sp. DSM 46838]
MTAETLGWQGKVVPVVSWTAMAVVFGLVGVRVLRMSRAEWASQGRD